MAIMYKKIFFGFIKGQNALLMSRCFLCLSQEITCFKLYITLVLI